MESKSTPGPLAPGFSAAQEKTDDTSHLFFSKVQHGQLNHVSQLLANDGSLASANHQGRTALCIAVDKGHIDIVDILLNHGADIEAVAPDGRRPLFIAAENGNTAIVELMAKWKASIESPNDIFHSTALLTACQRGHIEVVRLLLQLGADLEARLADGQTPLFLATASGDIALTQLLLQNGADTARKLKDGRTLIDVAEQNKPIVALLQRDYLLSGPKTAPRMDQSTQSARRVRCPRPPSLEEPEKLRACNAFDASIVQFFIGETEQRSKPVAVPVYDLLYGKGPVSIMADAHQHSGTDEKPSFTWYHLPANNVLQLFHNRYIDHATRLTS